MISTYSRVRASGSAVVVAVPTLGDLRTGRAEPEDEPAAAQVVERERGHRHRGR